MKPRGERWWTQVSRDPFGRRALMRRALRPVDLTEGETCGWCGQRNGHNGLYQYGWSDDQRATVQPIPGQFCSLPCLRSYHDMEA
jgi:hypothetical protein